jgi:hypothetical protein
MKIVLVKIRRIDQLIDVDRRNICLITFGNEAFLPMEGWNFLLRYDRRKRNVLKYS